MKDTTESSGVRGRHLVFKFEINGFCFTRKNQIYDIELTYQRSLNWVVYING